MSAVGVPPVWAVEKLHAAGIPVMNMIGSVRHVKKALDVGVDIICAQGTEGGGHTGETATTVLIPQVCDLVKGHKAPINGQPVQVIAAGGIFDGRGLAMALSLGASAVWVGTRFVAAAEAGCAPRHTQAVIDASSESTIRTIIFTGRPMRVLKNDYILDWENNRTDEIRDLTSKGILPAQNVQRQTVTIHIYTPLGTWPSISIAIIVVARHLLDLFKLSPTQPFCSIGPWTIVDMLRGMGGSTSAIAPSVSSLTYPLYTFAL